MDPKEKARLESLVKNNFWGIGNVIGGVAQAKEKLRTRLAEIDKYKSVYTPEELDNQRTKAKAEYNAARAQAHEGITGRLDELKNSINERHAQLDLSSPAWQTALQLLQAGVKDPETIHKINASFAHDQPALKALREVYKSQNISYDGGLDKQIYEPESAFNNLRENASRALMRDDISINSLASSIGKVAKLEGMEFDSSPDPLGFEEAVRKGAGLAQE